MAKPQLPDFNFYDFVGILAPGTLTLVGLSAVYPSLDLVGQTEDISAGEFGLLLILSYVAGHMTQAVGAKVSDIWWGVFGPAQTAWEAGRTRLEDRAARGAKPIEGEPTEWVRTNVGGLLAAKQHEALPGHLSSKLRLSIDDLGSIPKADWRNIVRQVYATVQAAGRSVRVDLFHANYAMFRGLIAGLLIVGAALWTSLPADKPLPRSTSTIAAFLVLGLVLSVQGMHRYGWFYARELFVQFLQVPSGGEAGGSDSNTVTED